MVRIRTADALRAQFHKLNLHDKEDRLRRMGAGSASNPRILPPRARARTHKVNRTNKHIRPPSDKSRSFRIRHEPAIRDFTRGPSRSLEADPTQTTTYPR